VYGAGWRLDATLGKLGRGEPFASATWEFTRVQDNTRGTITSAESAAGLGLGLGVRRQLLEFHSLGLVARYHHLFDARARGYLSATLEWGWQFGKKT
jgi:hypothetical protein